jgi:hypothetical protein
MTKVGLLDYPVVCVYSFQLLEQLTDFYKIWYEHYAIGDDSNLMLNFQQ